MARISTFALALSASLLGSAWAGTSPTLPFSNTALDKGELQLGFTGSYFETDANFDRDGNRARLNDGASFHEAQGGLFGQYGVSDDFTFRAHFPFESNTVTGTTTRGTPTTVTNGTYGPGDMMAAIRYQPVRQPLRFMADAQMRFPLYSRLQTDDWANLTGGGPMPLGTGVSEFTGMVRLELPISEDFYFGSGIGYTAHTGGFGNQLPYEGYLTYDESHALFFRAGIRGAIVIGSDEFSAFAPNNLPNERSTAVIAGSQAYNAIDPSYIKVEAGLGMHLFHDYYIHAGAEYPVEGKDIPASPSFIVSIGIDIGGRKTIDSGYHHSNRGFLEYYLPSKVIRVNNNLRQVLIDRGSNDGLKKGELLDVFEPDTKDGSFGEAVGRGRVLEVGPTRSKVQVLEYFKEISLQEGFVVRRPVR